MGLYVHLARVGPWQYEKQVWKRVAYACRYGHQSLDIVLHMGSHQLGLLIEALSDIVQDENGSKKGG